MRITAVDLPKHGLKWETFRGSPNALRFARRDLSTVELALRDVAQRRVCVQAGGCLGVFPKYLAQTFAVVHTFEPSPTNLAKMRENVSETNVVIHAAALGFDRTPIAIAQKRRTKTHAPAHEGIAHVSGPGDIHVMRLDDLDLPICDFLCLDLEGYELFALQGAEATIARCRPVVMVEINDNIGQYRKTPDDVRRLLTGWGYQFLVRVHSDEIYVYADR